jgi:hypothetical protein
MHRLDRHVMVHILSGKLYEAQVDAYISCEPMKTPIGNTHVPVPVPAKKIIDVLEPIALSATRLSGSSSQAHHHRRPAERNREPTCISQRRRSKVGAVHQIPYADTLRAGPIFLPGLHECTGSSVQFQCTAKRTNTHLKEPPAVADAHAATAAEAERREARAAVEDEEEAVACWEVRLARHSAVDRVK